MAEKKRPEERGYWRPHPATRELMYAVQEILEEYQKYLPLTIRQIFYRLVAEYGYEKTEKAYSSLCEHLKSARYAIAANLSHIPWEAIRDDTETRLRPVNTYRNATSFKEAVVNTAREYRTDRQAGQDFFLEIRLEATGGVGVIAPTAHEYGVPVYSNGGFDSVTSKHDLVVRAQERKQPTIILHIGDHDPSGVSMFENIDWELPGQVVRVAITPKQARAINAPSSPVKRPKTPAQKAIVANWIKTTGSQDTWQLEALAPPQLQQIVRAAIEDFQDSEVRRKTLARERRDRNRLVNFYRKL